MQQNFDPNNRVVQLCVKGISMDESGKEEDARILFEKAWREANDEFEKFIAAYFVAKSQKSISDQLSWFETSLGFAKEISDVGVQSAFPALYSHIAKCYEKMGDSRKAKEAYEHSDSYQNIPVDAGPFYHGTKADLQIGDMLKPGGESNYQDDLKMNHIYFTANIKGAGLAAALAKGGGKERIYKVEPTGAFENDPNVTDKKFPGNLTRSYRSQEPLKIVGEVNGWQSQTPEQLREWREKLRHNDGEIMN